MSTRRVTAVALVVLGVAAVAVGVALLSGGDGRDDVPPVAGTGALTRVLAGATPSASPFAAQTELQMRVGSRCLRVVVADTESERVQGLRGRRDLGPYDGMLFVFGTATDAGFTMSTVPVALEIGFYDGAGRRVSSRHMRPCPKAENECPVYTAGSRFRYALETLGGRLPGGSLGACPA